MGRPQELELFDLGLNEYERKLNVRHLARLRREFSSWHKRREHQTDVEYTRPRGETAAVTQYENGESTAGSQEDAREVLEFLRLETQRERDHIQSLTQIASEYQRVYSQATTEKERRSLILNFAANLGATRRQVRGDAAAFHREVRIPPHRICQRPSNSRPPRPQPPSS